MDHGSTAREVIPVDLDPPVEAEREVVLQGVAEAGAGSHQVIGLLLSGGLVPVVRVAIVEEEKDLEAVFEAPPFDEVNRRRVDLRADEEPIICVQLPLVVAAHCVIAPEPKLFARQECLVRELPGEEEGEAKPVGEAQFVIQRGPPIDVDRICKRV